MDSSLEHVYKACHSGFLSRLSLRVRTRMFTLFMESFRPTAETTVLDVGAMGNAQEREIETNYLERLYPHPERLHGLCVEDPARLRSQFPRSTFTQGDGRSLPFPDKAFDVVFSSAVLEHVGSREMQRRFVTEACRVGKRVFLTTPDRRFPVEAHSRLPFVAWLPDRLFRAALRAAGMVDLAKEENLNLLTERDLRRLFPPGARPRIVRIRLLGLTQNLVAIVDRTP